MNGKKEELPKPTTTVMPSDDQATYTSVYYYNIILYGALMEFSVACENIRIFTAHQWV